MDKRSTSEFLFFNIKVFQHRRKKPLTDFFSRYSRKPVAKMKTHLSLNRKVESIDLEFYHDIEEHWDKLFVVVNTQIEDMDELNALEDSLYSSLFEPNAEMLSGRVALSVG